MSVLHTGGASTLSHLIKMRALKVIAIILISCTSYGYAFPTGSLTENIDKCRAQLPQYKDTLLNNTFLPFLNNCDKTETTATMCTRYLDMVVFLSKTPNQTLFETQADVNHRLNELPKSFNSSEYISAFCTKFTDNHPNNTVSGQLYCLQSCSDINEPSGIRKLCALIYIGYAELNTSKQITAQLAPVVEKEEKSLEHQDGTINTVADAIKSTTGVNATATMENDHPKPPETQQPPAPPVIFNKHNKIVTTMQPQKNATAITAAAISKPFAEAVPPKPAHASTVPEPPKTAEHKDAVLPQELPKNVPNDEDDPDNHEADETGTDASAELGQGNESNENDENPNTDQETSPGKFEKPQKLEANPLNPKDNAIVRTAVLEDQYANSVDSNFFAYFMFLMFVCVVCYVGYHNKSKVLALVLEGRRTSGGRNGIGRRKHTAAYRKLDTNLEEAISSNSSGRTTQIIY